MATAFVLMASQLPTNGFAQKGRRGETYEPSCVTCTSRASCTTSGQAPLLKANADGIGVNDGFMATAHVLMASQLSLDGSSQKDGMTPLSQANADF
eukprot:15465426-Alexandrium_andersonii.AAC.1